MDDKGTIRELIDRYADAVFRRDFTTLASLFTADAVWSAGAPHDVRLEGEAIATTIAQMLIPFDFLIQMNGGTVINLDGDTATARTTVREVAQASSGELGLHSLGVYEDQLCRTDEGWRLAARHFQPVHVDGSALNGWTWSGRS